MYSIMEIKLKHSKRLAFLLPLIVVALLVLACEDEITPPVRVETPGCMDTTALNYDPEATVDDGSCDYLGCTDSTAVNYDPLATIDDGNCVPPQEILPDIPLLFLALLSDPGINKVNTCNNYRINMMIQYKL